MQAHKAIRDIFENLLNTYDSLLAHGYIHDIHIKVNELFCIPDGKPVRNSTHNSCNYYLVCSLASEGMSESCDVDWSFYWSCLLVWHNNLHVILTGITRVLGSDLAYCILKTEACLQQLSWMNRTERRYRCSSASVKALCSVQFRSVGQPVRQPITFGGLHVQQPMLLLSG